MASRITVVGAGVVGLSCAVALQEAGHEVQVIAQAAPTTSEVAGGLWLPYATGEDPRTLGWAVGRRRSGSSATAIRSSTTCTSSASRRSGSAR